MGSEFDELGAKVRRSQDAIEQIRGAAVGDGIRIEVDAGGKLVDIELSPGAMRSTSGKLAESIRMVYSNAVTDVQPKVDDALREVSDDPMAARLEQWVREHREAPAVVSRPMPVEDERSYMERRGGSIFEKWD